MGLWSQALSNTWGCHGDTASFQGSTVETFSASQHFIIWHSIIWCYNWKINGRPLGYKELERWKRSSEGSAVFICCCSQEWKLTRTFLLVLDSWGHVMSMLGFWYSQNKEAWEVSEPGLNDESYNGAASLPHLVFFDQDQILDSDLLAFLIAPSEKHWFVK